MGAEIDPNPDTPFVSAGGYNFGRRVRQPGGRKLKTCVERSGDLAVPGIASPPCQCAVFNNWGRPSALNVHFHGFTEYLDPPNGSACCSTQCGWLNDATDTYQGNGNGGKGPFAALYQFDDAAHYDDATGEWSGGGLGTLLPLGAFAASGIGYSCWFLTGPTGLTDPCNAGCVRAGVQIGYDTVAGVFVQIGLGGGGGVGEGWFPYYYFTWTDLCPPGALDCSGNGAFALPQLLGKTPYVWECKFGDGCGCGQPYWNFLCMNCKSDGDIVDPTGSSQGGVTAGLDCGAGGTNEVAPPCCCGAGHQECFLACLAANGACSFSPSQIVLCLSSGRYTGSGQDSAGNATSATLSESGGSWTISWACADGSGSHTFSGAEVSEQNGKLCLYAQNVSSGGCCASTLNISVGCHQDNCYRPCPCCGVSSAFDFDGAAGPPAEIQVTVPDVYTGACGACCDTAPGVFGGGNGLIPGATYLLDATNPTPLSPPIYASSNNCAAWEYSGAVNYRCWNGAEFVNLALTVNITVILATVVLTGGTTACFWTVALGVEQGTENVGSYVWGGPTFGISTRCASPLSLPISQSSAVGASCACPSVNAVAEIEWEAPT